MKKRKFKKLMRFLFEKPIVILLIMLKYNFTYKQAKYVYFNWYKTFKTL